MSEITIHTGFMGSWDTVNIDWFNENNVKQKNKVDIIVQEQDKPRILEIRIDGEVAAIIRGSNNGSS